MRQLRNSTEVVELGYVGKGFMEPLDIYILIASTAGGVTAIILAIFNIAKLFRAIHSSQKKVRLWLGRVKPMFREYRWWKKHRPSLEIVKVGKLEITEIHGKYHMQLEIDVRYSSNDSRYPTRMDCSTIHIDVLNKGKDRDKKPYRLHSSDWIWRISPLSEEGGYPHVPRKWDLPSNKSCVVRYPFMGEEMGLPLVDERTFFEIVAIGEAKIQRVSKSRQLKIGKKFPVEVDKKYE